MRFFPPQPPPWPPAARSTARWRFACLGALLAALLGPAGAHALVVQGTSNSARLVVSGDVVELGVELAVASGEASLDLELRYPIPATAAYLPGSLQVDGSGIADADPRVELDAGGILVRWPTVGAGDHSLRFRLRVQGRAGESIPHRFWIGGDFEPRLVHARPSWIEDESARLALPPLDRDAWIHQTLPGYNYGQAPALSLSTGSYTKARALLHFNLAGIAGDMDEEFIAARLELFPRAVDGADATIVAHRLRSNWGEGVASGSPCLSGVSWNAGYCLTGAWTPGGDYDGNIRGEGQVVGVDQPVVIEMAPLAHEWLFGGRDNFGVLLNSTAGGDGHRLSVASAEGADGEAPAASLAIISSAKDSYAVKAADKATGEISPRVLPAGSPSARVLYHLKVEGSNNDSGANRFRIGLPAGFGLAGVDSVWVDGVLLQPAAPAEYPGGEKWELVDTPGSVDLRLGNPIAFDSKPVLAVAFRVAVPDTINNVGFDFPAWFDADRRGYPEQAAGEGNATDLVAGDAWSVTTSGTQVAALSVVPADTSVARGQAVQYRAFAHFNDGSLVEVSELASWSVSPDSLASTSGSRVTGRSVGAGFVRASWGGEEGTGSLEVGPAAGKEIWIEPSFQGVALGDSAAYQAKLVTTAGDTLDVTATATWALADSTVAELVAPGSFRSLARGSTGISASVEPLAPATAELQVNPARLEGIVVTPADTLVALGYEAQLRAWGSYSDGSTKELTGVASWEAVPSGIVDLGADGSVRTLAEGSVGIRAVVGGRASDFVSFVVGPVVLDQLDGAPDMATLPLGVDHELTSTALYSDGSSADKTAVAGWESLDPGIATFLSPGVVRGVAAGTARLRHHYAGVEGDTLALEVTPVAIDSVVVEPAAVALPPGAAVDFRAIAWFNDGSQLDVSSQLVWSSDAPAVASVDAAGRATALADGLAGIGGSFEGQPARAASFTVDSAALDSLVIAPADTALAVGQGHAYRAVGHVGARQYELAGSVDWWVGDSAVASVDSTGGVVALGQGSTSVHAQLGAVVADAAGLEVGPPVVEALQVWPAGTVMLMGNQRQLDALAQWSDGSSGPIPGGVAWSSDAPSIAYVDTAGRLQGLGLGSTTIRASYAGVVATPGAVDVLPSTSLQALPGSVPLALPGAADQLLLSVRLRNNYLEPRELQALRVVASPTPPEGPDAVAASPSFNDDALSGLVLYADDGDGSFNPANETVLASGGLSGGEWSAGGLSLLLGVGEARTLHVAGHVSMTAAAHGDSVDLWVQDAGDLYWDQPAAAVAEGGFPLGSPGVLVVEDLVAAQLALHPVPADSVAPGSSDVVLLDLTVPADGPHADTLGRLELRQLGSAVAGTDIDSMRLQAAPQTVGPASPLSSASELVWSDVAVLSPVGGGIWIADGLGLSVGAGGRRLRVVADLDLRARTGRTLHGQLPVDGLQFSSGRRGPRDSAAGPASASTIAVLPGLELREHTPLAPATVERGATGIPLLGFELVSRTDEADTLRAVVLQHASARAGDAGADPHGWVDRVQLWWDRDEDGAAGNADSLLATAVPGSDGGIALALDGLALPPITAVHLLATLDLDAATPRHFEELRLRLEDAGAITTGTGAVAEPKDGAAFPLSTPSPPLVVGQAAAGYALRPVPGGFVLFGSQGNLALDLRLPGNGYEDDVLTGLRVVNQGSARSGQISSMQLWQDDGDGQFGDGDIEIAELSSDGAQWSVDGLSVPLAAGAPRRFYVAFDAASLQFNATDVDLQLPLQGVQVASSNDGPHDEPLDAGNSSTMAGGEHVTWVAETKPATTVDPLAQDRPVVVLTAFNGYQSSRTLTGLDLDLQGTATDNEFAAWELVLDANANGQLDDDEEPLALASPSGGELRFSGFAQALPAREQRRLLVAYSLAAGQARDASVVDAQVTAAEDIDYAPAGLFGTLSLGQFPLDSPGEDTVDGQVLRQLSQRAPTPLDLGGGEANVLLLDLLVPSNGWQSDRLEELTVEFSGALPARLGDELSALHLYLESGNATTGSFDPAVDLRLGTISAATDPIRFTGFDEPIPAQGRRLYVSADIAASPDPMRSLRLRLPTGAIGVASGNDGPRDGALEAATTHGFSSNELLVSLQATPLLLSAGQELDLDIAVRNRGSNAVAGIGLLDLQLPAGAVLVSGPSPTEFDLAPAGADTFRLRYRLDQPVVDRFVATVGPADSSVVGGPAPSAEITVQAPPSALVVAPLSTLPPSVNRGQVGVQPLVWQLAHADSSAQAAPVELRRVSLVVEDAGGSPQPASSVFRNLELRMGGQSLAYLPVAPDSARVSLPLDPPLRLDPGGSIDLPLLVSIADSASATDFLVRLEAASLVAVDANSEALVALQGTLPWATPSSLLRTQAPWADLAPAGRLPAGANRGQPGVPVYDLQFSLPGAPGESEARISSVALRLLDGDGNPRPAAGLLAGATVRAGSSVLFDGMPVDEGAGLLRLDLDVARIVASGSPELLELSVDLDAATAADSFSVALTDSSRYLLRDINSGDALPVRVAGDGAQGPLVLYEAPGAPDGAVASVLPPSTGAGAVGVQVLDLGLRHGGAPGEGAIELHALRLRPTDGQGAALVPSQVSTRARVTLGAQLLADDAAPPQSGGDWRIALAQPLALAPGDSVALRLAVDLAAAGLPAELRFSLDAGAAELFDANDGSRSLPPGSGLPFSTLAMRVVAPADEFWIDVAGEVPANVAVGEERTGVLPLRLSHPGDAGESDVGATGLVLRLRDAAGAPVGAAAQLAGARLATGSGWLDATLAGDSLHFDLSSLGTVAPGGSLDLSLALTVAPGAPADDFRLLLDSGALAVSGAPPVSGGEELSLPWSSPTVHVQRASLEESFSNYPNPFAAGREHTTVGFFLPQPARVTVRVHTLDGKVVRTLLDGVELPAGLHDELQWDGRNGDGAVVRNGAYLLRLVADGPGGGELLRKLAVLR